MGHRSLFCCKLTAKTSKSVLSSSTLASRISNVFVYLLHSPRTNSNAPKRTVTGFANPVIKSLINRIERKSEILPMVF